MPDCGKIEEPSISYFITISILKATNSYSLLWCFSKKNPFNQIIYKWDISRKLPKRE
jgi:hypothetical protein